MGCTSHLKVICNILLRCTRQHTMPQIHDVTHTLALGPGISHIQRQGQTRTISNVGTGCRLFTPQHEADNAQAVVSNQTSYCCNHSTCHGNVRHSWPQQVGQHLPIVLYAPPAPPPSNHSSVHLRMVSSTRCSMTSLLPNRTPGSMLPCSSTEQGKVKQPEPSWAALACRDKASPGQHSFLITPGGCRRVMKHIAQPMAKWRQATWPSEGFGGILLLNISCRETCFTCACLIRLCNRYDNTRCP
jgi:hypothetical protein